MGVQSSYRLGRAVVPELYKLRVDADMKRFTFSGEESISAKVTEKSDRIVMNSYKLKIKEAYVLSRNSKIGAKPITDDKKQRLTLVLEKSVIGKVDIYIRFEGKAGERMAGLYRSEYIEGGRKVNILTTQFESLYARQAFPCFDEPELKAAFELTLSADKEYSLVSNMPAKSTAVSKNRRVSEFMRTPVMSTYLLYMGVLKHAMLSKKYRGIEVRALAAQSKREYLKLPLEYTVKLLKFYEDYFGIRYPLPKLDVIAIPDFAASAMENWGAITFRESTLLVKDNSTVQDKQYAAMVIAHELAHQWFGDLVTMQWWNDIWLNESFAEFMAYKATAEVFPEFHMDIAFLLKTIDIGFSADEVKSTHPIEAEVKDPMDMDRAFDDVSYRKGGSVLSMIEDYVGKATFRKGLHAYLKRHMYSNTVRDDLWNAIESVAGSKLQVKKVANAWITQKGYPYIRVEDDFRISQARFIFGRLRNSDKTVWPIPITYASGSGKNYRMLFDKRSGRVKNVGGWMKLNYGQKGFYRTFYDKKDLMKLGHLVKDGRLGWNDGWGIVNDLFILARAGNIKIAEYLEFVELFRKRCEYPMASTIMAHLRWMYDTLPENHPLRSRINLVCIDYAQYHLKKLGWTPKNGESSIDTQMRAVSIGMAGVSGDKDTAAKAGKLFDNFKDRGIEIDPSIRSTVLWIVARNGNAKLYEWFKSKYVKETDPARKYKEYMYDLGDFRNESILKNALDFSMSSYVRDQDKWVIPKFVSSNPVGRSLIFDWTKKNWHVILEKFEIGNGHMASRYIENLSFISDSVTKDKIQKFFTKKENFRKDIKPTLDKTMEKIDMNIRFLNANRK